MKSGAPVTRKRRRYVSRPRHPVTGRPMYLSAETPAGLAHLVHVVQRMRDDLDARAVSPEDVIAKLARMRFGPVTLERAARSYMETDLAANTRRRVASSLATHLVELARLELHQIRRPARRGVARGPPPQGSRRRDGAAPVADDRRHRAARLRTRMDRARALGHLAAERARRPPGVGPPAA